MAGFKRKLKLFSHTASKRAFCPPLRNKRVSSRGNNLHRNILGVSDLSTSTDRQVEPKHPKQGKTNTDCNTSIETKHGRKKTKKKSIITEPKHPKQGKTNTDCNTSIEAKRRKKTKKKSVITDGTDDLTWRENFYRRYKCLRLIGQGVYGRVSVAVNKFTKKLVAVKMQEQRNGGVPYVRARSSTRIHEVKN